MKSITIKISDKLFVATEIILWHNISSLNSYLNEALKSYNILQKRKLLGEKLAGESFQVKEESISVLHEFEEINDSIP
ncbi:MAG: hypothetical protein PHT07_07050 [Paludibacter sp.]|nr:hypothetical protein [Paludibacter sp.]